MEKYRPVSGSDFKYIYIYSIHEDNDNNECSQVHCRLVAGSCQVRQVGSVMTTVLDFQYWDDGSEEAVELGMAKCPHDCSVTVL